MEILLTQEWKKTQLRWCVNLSVALLRDREKAGQTPTKIYIYNTLHH